MRLFQKYFPVREIEIPRYEFGFADALPPSNGGHTVREDADAVGETARDFNPSLVIW
jgi:hypothetical protein